MPLTERQEYLLHELYGIPTSADTIVLGESGFAQAPPLAGFAQSPRQHLAAAILRINADEFKVDRVIEILATYEEIALDPSAIERDGYKFRHSQSLKNLQDRLYPFTGILLLDQGGNRLCLG